MRSTRCSAYRPTSFSPQQKLVDKRRDGAKVLKRYDTAQTAYRRVLTDPRVLEKIKAGLTRQYRELNPAPAAPRHPRPLRPATRAGEGQAPAKPTASHAAAGPAGGLMSSPRRQGRVDGTVRCRFADDPARRPHCTFTAVVRYGPVALCPSCAAQRSTVGKGQAPVALAAGPALEVLDWVAAAQQQITTAERTLAAAVIRARQASQPWSAIGTQMGTSRQAAQQRSPPRRPSPAPPGDHPARGHLQGEATKHRSRAS